MPPDSPQTATANRYTREVQDRGRRRELEASVETAHGLQRNAAESSFASLMRTPQARRTAATAAATRRAGTAVWVEESDKPARPGGRRRLLLAATLIAGSLVLQAAVVLAWVYVLNAK